jgi:DNA repair exonuclease SbcCD ATPase subunit
MYLGTLSDGNILATWQTLTRNGKGELKEKFTIDVTSITGGLDFKSLSGGEKRKVRLATAMALADLVSSRATKPIDLLIADEVDDAVDSSGLERLMVVLEQKAQERGTLFVISHNDLASYIRQTLTIRKSNGLASFV